MKNFFFYGALALYFTLVFNFSFLVEASAYLKSGNLTWSSTPVLLTPVLVLFCLFVSLFSCLSLKYIEKYVFIFLTLLSAILSYAYVYYGVIFDDHSVLIDAIEQTDFIELNPFLTLSFLLWFLFLGVLPSCYIYKVQLIRAPFGKNLLIKISCILLFPICYVLILWPLSSSYQKLVRLSGIVARPPFQIFPTNFIESAANHYKEKMVAFLPYQKLGLDAFNASPHQDKKNNLLILVIGETARSANFELNGYQRPTNPYTKPHPIISFRHMSSCGTSTRISVPCIFSAFKQKEFLPALADKQDNLLDILQRAGLNVHWLDNNGKSFCQGVCKHIQAQQLTGFDNELISQLPDTVKKMQGRDSVLILHLQGSHGPNYYAKYPPAFRRFVPDCQKNELRGCDPKALLNAYDNTIVYTDFILSEVIQFLIQQEKHWNSLLIYTSDHGESLGEHGIYGHCAPYWLAPTEQTQVPLLVWLAPAFIQEKKIAMPCMRAEALEGTFSHDNIFHSVLGVMDIRTELYNRSLDLFNTCRTGNQGLRMKSALINHVGWVKRSHIITHKSLDHLSRPRERSTHSGG